MKFLYFKSSDHSVQNGLIEEKICFNLSDFNSNKVKSENGSQSDFSNVFDRL